MRSQSFGVTIMAGLGCKEKCGTNSLIVLFPHIFPQHLLDPVEKKLTATPTTLSRIFINFLGIKV